MTHDPRRLALPRRAFLRGAGAAVALPFLDAMVPAFAAEPDLPVRFAVVYAPNGRHMPTWTPSADGPSYELPWTLVPLAPVRADVAVWTGFAADKARAHGDGPGDHARAAAAFLTGAHPRKTGGSDVHVGVSADQIAAAKIGAGTALRSLEVGIEPGRPSGECDSGYACAYSNNLAWMSATVPLAKETDPREVFDRLFAESTLPAEERARRAAERRSVLDFALDDAKRLDARLGPSDRRKLDEYLTAVREMEARIERSLRDLRRGAPSGEIARPAAAPPDLAEHIRIQFGLIALAFRSDRTRVVTFMLGNEGSNRSHRFLGAPEGHHDLSHHGGDAAKNDKLRLIDRWHVEQFAAFVALLRDAKEGEGTILDRSAVVYGSGISDGNAHDHHDLPILTAGRVGGLPTGTHVRVPRETPVANLWLGVLDRLGVRAPSFGDSTGRV